MAFDFNGTAFDDAPSRRRGWKPEQQQPLIGCSHSQTAPKCHSNESSSSYFVCLQVPSSLFRSCSVVCLSAPVINWPVQSQRRVVGKVVYAAAAVVVVYAIASGIAAALQTFISSR